jgi:phospholipid/cholesterol/gamma-HCH transport system ATP-binding protein
VLLTSENPVITQFVNGRRFGPIGMSEEKDEATLAAEKARNGDSAAADVTLALVPQLVPSDGLPERQAVRRHTDRVIAMLPTLPLGAQRAILAELGEGQPGGAGRPGQPQTEPLAPALGDPGAVERERAQTQARAEAWKLARERAAQQGGAEQPGAEQPSDGPGSWPADWPGGSG